MERLTTRHNGVAVIRDKSKHKEAMEKLARYEEAKVIPLSEIYRIIAGHSDYHGDNILSAVTCIAEGKEVKPIKPLEE